MSAEHTPHMELVEAIRDGLPDWAQHDPRPSNPTPCPICLALRALEELKEQFETLREAAQAFVDRLDNVLPVDDEDETTYANAEINKRTWAERVAALRVALNPAKCPDCLHDAHTPRYCVIDSCSCGEPGSPNRRGRCSYCGGDFAGGMRGCQCEVSLPASRPSE